MQENTGEEESAGYLGSDSRTAQETQEAHQSGVVADGDATQGIRDTECFAPHHGLYTEASLDSDGMEWFQFYDDSVRLDCGSRSISQKVTTSLREGK